MELTKIYSGGITAEIETRLGKVDIKSIRSFCDGISERLKSIDPNLEIQSRKVSHSNLEKWLFSLHSPYLMKLLGEGYAVTGKGEPFQFAEMEIYKHSGGGYHVFQRLDFGLGQVLLKKFFEKETGAGFETYEGGVRGMIYYDGLISFSEETPNLPETSFEGLVKLYYQQAGSQAKGKI